MSQDLDISLRTLWAAAPASMVQWATGRPCTRPLQRGETQLSSLRRDMDTVALAKDPELGRFVFHLEGEGSIELKDEKSNHGASVYKNSDFQIHHPLGAGLIPTAWPSRLGPRVVG